MIILLILLCILIIAGTIIFHIRQQSQQATRRRYHRKLSIQRVEKEKVEINTDETWKLSKKDIQEQNQSVKNGPSDVKKIQDYFTLYIMAPKEYPYNGYELLQALLANGLRYGKRNIFHRHETKAGHAHILFSVASVSKPGTFELSKIGNFFCPGLVLFMILNQVQNPMHSFNILLETARQLIEDLGGGIVWDEERRLLTMDTISQLRARIHCFEESQ